MGDTGRIDTKSSYNAMLEFKAQEMVDSIGRKSTTTESRRVSTMKGKTQ